MSADEILGQLDKLLDLPRQIWLLGAGISKEAGVPLMYPLTDQVEKRLDEGRRADFRAIRESLKEQATVEDVMSHIGDLVSMAGRARTGAATLPTGEERSVEDLNRLHGKIQGAIRDVVRWGYTPAEDGQPEKSGSSDEPIITITDHRCFVEALFGTRGAGLERRPPITLVTTNYDTLLEDALALNQVGYVDGFDGGAMGFWNNRFFGSDSPPMTGGRAGHRARVLKLHGSIDWYADQSRIAMRRRDGASYPDAESIELLIYPQAAKYYAVRQQPFVALFDEFRDTLVGSAESAIFICGYSFGDAHINDEIERAMERSGNDLTLVAFLRQAEAENGDLAEHEGLPPAIVRWLQGPCKDRVIVAGNRGFYHGSLGNQWPVDSTSAHSWWSFRGLSDFLRTGPEEPS